MLVTQYAGPIFNSYCEVNYRPLRCQPKFLKPQPVAMAIYPLVVPNRYFTEIYRRFFLTFELNCKFEDLHRQFLACLKFRKAMQRIQRVNAEQKQQHFS